MANAYVKDPRKIAKPGDVVRVKLLEVDPKRRRISLTMRLDRAPEGRPSTARADIAPAASEKRLRLGEARANSSNRGSASGDAMTEAFRRAGLTDKTTERRWGHLTRRRSPPNSAGALLSAGTDTSRNWKFESSSLQQTVRVSHKPGRCRSRTAGFTRVCAAGLVARSAETRRRWSGTPAQALISLPGHIPVPQWC